MRVIWMAVLAALTVSGCDINTTPKEAKVDCNCTAPAQPPAGMRGSTDTVPPPAHHRYRSGHTRSYAVGGGHSYYWRREYSEISVATYDYHSDSHSYVVGESGEGYSGASASAYASADGGGSAYAGAAAHGGDGYRVVEGGWVDGYGRGHAGGGATAGEPVHYETPGTDHGRSKPWHGYDVDCPDKDRKH